MERGKVNTVDSLVHFWFSELNEWLPEKLWKSPEFFCTVIHFGNAEFEMLISYSSRDVRKAIHCMEA
jgi:hypothetical protein